MKLQTKKIEMANLQAALRAWNSEGRLGLLTSIDGDQLLFLVLKPATGECELWETPVENSSYPTLTTSFPQAHWFERTNRDLFGILAEKHPRMNPMYLHPPFYKPDFFPLRNTSTPVPQGALRLSEHYKFLEVKGDGVFELPVGPIHAGVIEPGHFRFSCLGEIIVNLELELGWLHRGVEKRVTEVPWKKARFVAEAASSDTALANALAHAIAIESLLEIEVPPLAQTLRTMALEIERAAMHIIDIGGAAHDVGYLGISSAAGRLRGQALALGTAVSGTRIMRSFVKPGGVQSRNRLSFADIRKNTLALIEDLKPVLSILEESQPAAERMEVGRVTKSLANEFGMVGVIARASGVNYDTRSCFAQGKYPGIFKEAALELQGNVLARTHVRTKELWSSLATIVELCDDSSEGDISVPLPDNLPANSAGAGIVEAFRGELIHLALTDDNGKIMRYSIKDPSFTNWTAISVAIRNNLIADFPLCNKSMALSYSGNDL